MSSEDLSLINKSSYLNDAVVHYWSHYKSDFFYGEDIIFSDQRDFLASASLLDIGVGGGRTTKGLRLLVKDYTGLDYSEKLIEECRAKFPDVEFICDNACQLEAVFRDRRFDFIYFSFNGIDCLNIQQRLCFLEQANGALAGGGRLLFSSHNLRAADYRSRTRALAQSTNKFLRFLLKFEARNACREVLSLVNYFKISGKEYRGEDVAYIVDPGQCNREIYVWIEPQRQVRELQEAGFRVLAVYDWSGRVFSLDKLSQISTHSAYYLSEKI